MAIEIFNRCENKYLLHDEDTFEKLRNHLSDYMQSNKGKRSVYTISNLYYDTDDSQLIRTSLEKPVYKEKLRVRAYGVPDEDSSVYVEIKKKVAGMVNKRRSVMKLSEAYDFLKLGVAPELKPYMNRQVLPEIETMLNRYTLKPMLYLSYDRTALGENNTDDVRITFDTSITTRRYDLRLESGCYGEKLLPDGVRLMEIKAKHNMPLWLSKLLDEHCIYPVSFSKYGTEYKKTLAEQRRKVLYIVPATGSKQNAIRYTSHFAERMVSHA